MFGLGLPFLSYFRRQVGLRGEPPNSAGSLHAKTALLGDPNPTVSGRDTVMKYFKRIDELVSICVPSDTIRKELNVERISSNPKSTSTNTTYSVTKSFVVPRGGKIRLKFDVKGESASYQSSWSIFVNGSSVASANITSISYYTVTQDIFVKDFDRVDVTVYSGRYSWSSCGYTYYNYYSGYLKNEKVCYDMAEGAFVISD